MEEKKSNKKEVDFVTICSYLGILVLIPLLTDAKDKPFTKFHVKQGLLLFILEVITTFVAWIPGIGWFLSLFWILWIILGVMGILNVLNKEEKELPIIGKYAYTINI